MLPKQVMAELSRFVLLLPLAHMEFRAEICEQVSCSDASMLGGGICVSQGLTEYGVAATNARVRGDIPEPHDLIQVLTVGLFDGVGALRVAADTLGLPVAGHLRLTPVAGEWWKAGSPEAGSMRISVTSRTSTLLRLRCSSVTLAW